MLRKYQVNHSFFKEENEKSFYVAGFIAADGCLEHEKNRNRYRFSIELSSEDESHLYLIRDLMSSDAKISRRIRKDPRFLEETEQSCLRITSKEIYLDIQKFGITTNKSQTYKIPEWMISHPLKHHFMRGLFDGDGGFSIKPIDRRNKKEYLRFSLTGTYEELEKYNDILTENCKIPANKISKVSGCWHIEYAKNEVVKLITDFIYKDASIFLPRKYNLFHNWQKKER
jgi:LAGLIDADG-like domain